MWPVSLVCSTWTIPFAGTFSRVSIKALRDRIKNQNNVVLVLDVSGSMSPNLIQLRASALACLDSLPNATTTLRIIKFDEFSEEILSQTTLTDETRPVIQKLIVEKLVTRGLPTNLEYALRIALNRPNQTILFITDGLANRGILGCEQLISMIRDMPHYETNVIHTLGLQLEGAEVNTRLLNSMALDSNGVFTLAETTEGLSEVVGTLLAEMETRVFSKCDAKLIIQQEAPKKQFLATLVSDVPKQGFNVRNDANTFLVFKWTTVPLGPLGPLGGPLVQGAAEAGEPRETIFLDFNAIRDDGTFLNFHNDLPNQEADASNKSGICTTLARSYYLAGDTAGLQRLLGLPESDHQLIQGLLSGPCFVDDCQLFNMSTLSPEVSEYATQRRDEVSRLSQSYEQQLYDGPV